MGKMPIYRRISIDDKRHNPNNGDRTRKQRYQPAWICCVTAPQLPHVQSVFQRAQRQSSQSHADQDQAELLGTDHVALDFWLPFDLKELVNAEAEGDQRDSGSDPGQHRAFEGNAGAVKRKPSRRIETVRAGNCDSGNPPHLPRTCQTRQRDRAYWRSGAACLQSGWPDRG